MTWAQNYDPLHNTVLSTAVAAVPILLLLIMIATNKVKTYWAAAIALVLTLLIAIYVFTMPAGHGGQIRHAWARSTASGPSAGSS